MLTERKMGKSRPQRSERKEAPNPSRTMTTSVRSNVSFAKKSSKIGKRLSDTRIRTRNWRSIRVRCAWKCSARSRRRTAMWVRTSPRASSSVTNVLTLPNAWCIWNLTWNDIGKSTRRSATFARKAFSRRTNYWRTIFRSTTRSRSSVRRVRRFSARKIRSTFTTRRISRWRSESTISASCVDGRSTIWRASGKWSFFHLLKLGGLNVQLNSKHK